MKKQFLKRMALISLTAAMVISGTACQNKKASEDGNVTISIAGWPTKNDTAYENENALKKKFETSHPNVTIKPDNYKYQVQTFMTKAGGNQLATLFSTPITETRSVIENGWAADITDALKKRTWYQAMNEDLIDWMSDENGKIYGIPTDVYAQGLFINKKLFKQAGLVNSDGTVKTPQTYKEVAEYAEIIKEKTGKAGFVFPSTNNCGGWHFMNVAWAYGTEFMKQESDGSWKATFDTQSTRDALQYIYDLKWKYNALLDDTVIDQPAMEKYVGAEQAAMAFMDIKTGSSKAVTYGMNKDDICFVSMPEGPEGRISQMGGTIYYIRADASAEQIDAVLDWLELKGYGPYMTDDSLETLEEGCKTKIANGKVVFDRIPFPIWTSEEANQKVNEIYKKYTNVDASDYEKYFAFEGVIVKPEYAQCCQELYATFDKCIQEVLTNKNADIAALVKNANAEFQVNYLDKLTR